MRAIKKEKEKKGMKGAKGRHSHSVSQPSLTVTSILDTNIKDAINKNIFLLAKKENNINFCTF